jgi:TP901 family phage tail tape measure protein
MASRDLKVSLIGDDQTGKAFGSAGGGAQKFAAIGVAAMAALAAGAAAAAGALFKIGDSFDESYDTIRVGTGATGDALNALKDDFRAVVSSVPTDFASASTAIADINTRLGLTGQPLQNVSKQFLELSRITKTDVAGNIDAGTAALNSFGATANQQPAFLDQIFRASQNSGVGFAELSNELAANGTVLRAVGFDFTESTALIAALGKAGVSTSDVMPALSRTMKTAAEQGKDAGTVFQETFDAIKAAPDATSAAQVAMEVFGDKAGPKLAAMVREGKLSFEDMLAAVQGGSDTIMQAGADTMDFGEKWTMFKNNVLLALEPVATRVFNSIGEALDRFSAWWSTNGPTIIATATTIGTTLVAAFGSATDALRTAFGFLSDNSTVFTVVAGIIAAVFIPHFVAMATAATVNAAKTVVAWVTTQVAAIKAAAVHSGQVVGMVAKWVAMSVGATVNAAKVVAGWVATSAGAIAAGAVMAAQTAVHVAKWAFLGAQSLLHAAKVAAAWLIAIGPIGLVIAAVVGLVALIIANWDTIKRVTVDLWNSVKAATSAAWDWIKGAVSAAVSAVSGAVSGAWNAVKGATAAAWDAVKGATSAAWDAVRSFVSGAIDAALGAVGRLGAIPGQVAGWFGSARDGAVRALDSLVGFVGGIPGRITGALGNLGGLLSDAGRRVIQGFIDGITGAFGRVRDTLKKLTGMLPDWKGPADKDAKLLYGAGKLVMGGLDRGLRDSFGDIKSTMSDATDLIGMNARGTGYVMDRLSHSTPAPTAHRNLTVNINAAGENIDENRLMTLLSRAERLAGY